MPTIRFIRRFGRGEVLAAAAASFLLFAAVGASSARAASPVVKAAWAAEVSSSAARLWGEIELDPAQETRYSFDYISEGSYAANVKAGRPPFTGALSKPAFPLTIPAGEAETTVSARLTALLTQTAYRYRLVVENGSGSAESQPNRITTQALGGGALLADGRGWEMVSPVQKGGGQVDGPGETAGGGVLQAAADGNSITYSSAISSGSGSGAPPGAQYVSRRGSGSWSTQNITTPVVSGGYDTVAAGVPYQLFSGDLARALLLNGQRCREGGAGCAVANPPLPDSGAPTGYQNYYLRDNAASSFQALLDDSAVARSSLAAAEFGVRLAGASPDLKHVVLASCSKLTADASEVSGAAGCDPEAANLYELSEGDISLVNVLPGDTQGTPGAALAAQAGAISADGSRVYFTQEGNLYLRQGDATKLVAPGGEFQTASADGSVAFYTSAGHLFRYEVAAEASTDLVQAGGVLGVLGASADGSYLYYQTVAGLFLRHQSTVREVAAGAAAVAASSYPPTTATARIAADGTLVFLSEEPLTEYDNVALESGEVVSEIFRYDPGADRLACLSCNPTGGRPLGASSIPGAIANGTAPGSVEAYRPRALSASSNRVYFDSEDALVVQDSNAASDVYQWEAAGTGSCAQAEGCLSLISSGKSGGAFFVDASSEGGDVFFRTDRSLVKTDPGSYDIYDARVGGGFPEPTPPFVCEGDSCQILPSDPVDPVMNTLSLGPGNPPIKFFNTTRRKPVYHRLRHHHHKGKKGERGKRSKNRGGSR